MLREYEPEWREFAVRRKRMKEKRRVKRKARQNAKESVEKVKKRKIPKRDVKQAANFKGGSKESATYEERMKKSAVLKKI